MGAAQDGALLLYHEQQEASLCGVHCLNTLLQGPYFSGFELSQIAAELDAAERAFMAENGMDTDEFLRYVAEDSGNVAADGNFSLQVLSKALEVWDLQTLNLGAPEMAAPQQHPEREQAFICNLQEHWFTIRRVQAEWYDFNSLFPAPKPLSELYLDAFLGTLKRQGYSIFVVRGSLPQHQHPDAGQPDSRGSWWLPEQARAATKESGHTRQAGHANAAAQGLMDMATQEGTKLSLRKRSRPTQAEQDSSGWEQWPDGGGAGGQEGDEDDALQKALAASLADGFPPAPAPLRPPAAAADARPATGAQAAAAVRGGNQAAVAQGATDANADAVPHSRAAATQAARDSEAEADEQQHSLEPEPDAGPGLVTLAFRMPDGSRLQRRFAGTQRLEQLHAYLRSNGWQKAVLSRGFPRQVLSDASKTLCEANLADKEVLVVQAERS